jgi:hypothetical protein
MFSGRVLTPPFLFNYFTSHSYSKDNGKHNPDFAKQLNAIEQIHFLTSKMVLPKTGVLWSNNCLNSIIGNLDGWDNQKMGIQTRCSPCSDN